MEANSLIIPELNEKMIESMIYVIRGQKVMLDFDLAEVYGYETKNFNRQVKNNISKFDEDFMFKLTREEYNDILRCKNFTSSWGGTRHLPYAFTEQGIYMLMTVLKGELAVKQSKTLIRMFKKMKDYLIENDGLLTQNNYLNLFKLINANKDKIQLLEEEFKKISKAISNHYLILNGEKVEADVAYQEIYKLAKNTIYIIDDYIDIKTLQLLKVANENINIIIFSDNKAKNKLNSNFVKDFISDTGFSIQFKKNNNRFHDRYIIIDFNEENESIFHCGASSKDAGKKITTITKVEESSIYKNLINEILNHDELIIRK